MRAHVPGVEGGRTLLDVLPGMFGEDPVAVQLVAAFDEVLAPVWLTLDNLAAYLDPGVAPADFVGELNRWMAAYDHPWLDTERRREILRGAATAHSLRGSKAGLSAAITAVTGIAPQIDECGGTAWSTEAGTPPPGDAAQSVGIRIATGAVAAADARFLTALARALVPAQLSVSVEVVAEPPPPPPPLPAAEGSAGEGTGQDNEPGIGQTAADGGDTGDPHEGTGAPDEAPGGAPDEEPGEEPVEAPDPVGGEAPDEAPGEAPGNAQDEPPDPVAGREEWS